MLLFIIIIILILLLKEEAAAGGAVAVVVVVEAKYDWDFQISDRSETLMELILTPVVNFCDVRRAQLVKSALLTSMLVPLGSFQICSDAK